MYHTFINITPTVLFKLQCFIVLQMAPLVTVSAHCMVTVRVLTAKTRHDDEG